VDNFLSAQAKRDHPKAESDGHATLSIEWRTAHEEQNVSTDFADLRRLFSTKPDPSAVPELFSKAVRGSFLVPARGWPC